MPSAWSPDTLPMASSLDSHDPNTLHRFQHAPAPYYLSHPQPGLEPLSTAIPSFQQQQQQPRQQPWILNVHTSYSHHGHTSTAIPDRSPPHGHPPFYAAGPDAQMVGYPESSQRTLLQDAAYANMYAVSYPSPSPGVSYQGTPNPAPAGTYSPPAATPAEELQSALDSHSLARSGYRGVQPLPERRTSFSLAEQYLAGRTQELYSPGAGARYAPLTPAAYSPSHSHPHSHHSHHSHSHSHSHSQSHAHSHSHSHHAFQMGSPTSPYDGALLDAHSPRAAPYPMPLPLRRDSLDSLAGAGAGGDPISPSSVPALVFDGDEYDDDSESSLPSAASEVQRVPYRAPAGEYDGDGLADGGREWARSPESANTAGTAEGDALGAPNEGAHALDRERERERERGGARAPQKKSKMHQCTICLKLFPRPSGLATHMNSHSGAKPFKCPIPTCTKSFAVRSNAKRHLRTHGIFPSSEHGSTSPSQFTVGFDTPLVTDVQDAGTLPAKLRWVPPSLAARTNAGCLRADGAASDSEDEYFQPACPLLALPLPPVAPSSPAWGEDAFEERNSYAQAESAPYISSQWRSLPGPAIASPTSF